MWNAIDSSSCSNCLVNLAEKDGNYRTYKICFTLDPGNGSKIVEEATVYEALSTIFSFKFLYDGTSAEFDEEKNNSSDEITIPLCLSCAYILKELFRRFQEFSYQRRPNSLIASKLDRIEANFMRIHGNIMDPLVITSDVQQCKVSREEETQTESPYVTETFTQVDSPEHSPRPQESSPAMTNDVEKNEKATTTDPEIRDTNDNATQTFVHTTDASALTETPCITSTEVQTELAQARDIETNTEHGSAADSDTQTEIILSDQCTETEPEPVIATTEFQSQTDVLQYEEKSTFTEVAATNNETQTQIVVSTDVGVITEQPELVVVETQTDILYYAEIGIATEQPELVTADSQTDVLSYSDIGIATEQPEAVTADSQTDVLSYSEIGIATEQPEAVTADTQTDVLSYSEIGVATEQPGAVVADTQTDMPSFSEIGITTEQPEPIGADTQTDILSFSEIGITTEQPEPIVADTQTDIPSFSEIGMTTEQPEPIGADTQTDILSFSEIGITTEKPEPIVADTQTDIPSFSEIGMTTEQPEPIGADTQTDILSFSEIGITTEKPEPIVADTQTEQVPLFSRETSTIRVKSKSLYSQTDAKLAVDRMTETDMHVETVEAGIQTEEAKPDVLELQAKAKSSAGLPAVSPGRSIDEPLVRRRSKRHRTERRHSPDICVQIDYPNATIKVDPECGVDEIMSPISPTDVSIVNVVPRKRSRRLISNQEAPKVEVQQSDSDTEFPEAILTKIGRRGRKVRISSPSVPLSPVVTDPKLVPHAKITEKTRRSPRRPTLVEKKPSSSMNPIVLLVDIMRPSSIKASTSTQSRNPVRETKEFIAQSPVCSKKIPDVANQSPVNNASKSLNISSLHSYAESNRRLALSATVVSNSTRRVAVRSFVVVENLPTDDQIRELKPAQKTAPYCCRICKTSVYSLKNYRTHVTKHLLVNRYTCKKSCGFSTPSYFTFKAHCERHHATLPILSENSSETFDRVIETIQVLIQE